jgi:hypothetical protein
MKSPFTQTVIKIFLMTICLTFIQEQCHGNDAAYYGDGADVFPLENTDIQLVSESININYSDMSTVDVHMIFKNLGKDTTVQMGFPVYSDSTGDEGYNYHFQTWVDGNKVTVTKKRGIPDPVKSKDGAYSNTVYTYNVLFKQGEIKKETHSYVVGGYRNAIGDRRFAYILRTGALWKGFIEQLDIVVKMDLKQVPLIDCLSPKEHSSTLSGNELTLLWAYKNIKPNEDIEIVSDGRNKYWQDDIHAIATGSKKKAFIAQECRIRVLKNRVFATYGYPFKSPFIKSSYYYPNSPYKEDHSFSMVKIPKDIKAFLDYLGSIEAWRKNVNLS